MRFLLIFQLAFGIYLPSTASASTPLTPPMLNQMVSDIALNQMFKRFGEVKRGVDLVKLLPADMPARDLRWAREATKSLTKPIKFERLTRAIALTYDGKRHVIAIEDALNAKLRVDGKADFTYQPANPLEIQIDVLNRALNKKQAFLTFGLPEAHAIVVTEIIIGGIIGGLVAAGLGLVLSNAGTVFQQVYCPGRTKADGYFTATTCEKYFDWAEKNNKPSDRVPNKDEIKAEGTHAGPVTPAYVENDCGRSKFTSIIDDEVRVDMAVKYDGKKADKITVKQASVKPAKDEKPIEFEISLDANSQLQTFKVATTGEILGTNDTSVTSKMTPTQLAQNQEQVKKGAKLVTAMVGFLEFCKQQGEQTLAKNSAQTPESVAGSVATPAVVAPVVPTSAPTSTK